MKPTAKQVRNLLAYSSSTGIFRWKIAVNNNTPAGSIAGTKNTKGYIQISLGGTIYYAHRLAWLIKYGKWPVKQIDHRDRNRGNNKFRNLREATHSENRQNSKIYVTNKSGYTGVAYYGNKWVAYIQVKKKQLYLGSFATRKEALSVRRKAEKYHFGTFRSTEGIGKCLQ